MTIKSTYGDSKYLAAQLREIAKRLDGLGMRGDSYYLNESAVHIEELYQEAKRIEKRQKRKEKKK